jgi:hybrid cluster-associated redox disulfide protein
MARPRIDDPDLPLADLMTSWPAVISVFQRHRMLCVGCLIAPFHTVTDACREYGLEEDAFLHELMQAVGMGDG